MSVCVCVCWGLKRTGWAKHQENKLQNKAGMRYDLPIPLVEGGMVEGGMEEEQLGIFVTKSKIKCEVIREKLKIIKMQ